MIPSAGTVEKPSQLYPHFPDKHVVTLRQVLSRHIPRRFATKAWPGSHPPPSIPPSTILWNVNLHMSVPDRFTLTFCSPGYIILSNWWENVNTIDAGNCTSDSNVQSDRVGWWGYRDRWQVMDITSVQFWVIADHLTIPTIGFTSGHEIHNPYDSVVCLGSFKIYIQIFSNNFLLLKQFIHCQDTSLLIMYTTLYIDNSACTHVVLCWLLVFWRFLSSQHLSSYQDGYWLVKICTHGDYRMKPNWETRPPEPCVGWYSIHRPPFIFVGTDKYKLCNSLILLTLLPSNHHPQKKTDRLMPPSV